MHRTYQINIYHDVLNLIDTWIQLTLCLRQVYASKHFHHKTAFECLVPVAKTSHLTQYLSEFMQHFDKIGLQNTKMIELNIISKESEALLQCHQLSLECFDFDIREVDQVASFQDLNFKTFLTEQMEMMRKMPKITEKCTFRLRVLADIVTKQRVEKITESWHMGKQLQKAKLKDSCFLRSGNILITSSVF